MACTVYLTYLTKHEVEVETAKITYWNSSRSAVPSRISLLTAQKTLLRYIQCILRMISREIWNKLCDWILCKFHIVLIDSMSQARVGSTVNTKRTFSSVSTNIFPIETASLPLQPIILLECKQRPFLCFILNGFVM